MKTHNAITRKRPAKGWLASGRVGFAGTGGKAISHPMPHALPRRAQASLRLAAYEDAPIPGGGSV